MQPSICSRTRRGNRGVDSVYYVHLESRSRAIFYELVEYQGMISMNKLNFKLGLAALVAVAIVGAGCNGGDKTASTTGGAGSADVIPIGPAASQSGELKP